MRIAPEHIELALKAADAAFDQAIHDTRNVLHTSTLHRDGFSGQDIETARLNHTSDAHKVIYGENGTGGRVAAIRSAPDMASIAQSLAAHDMHASYHAPHITQHLLAIHSSAFLKALTTANPEIQPPFSNRK